MWPFRKPGTLSRREVQAAFGRFLSPDAIERLAAPDLTLPPRPLRAARVDFALIALADELWQGPQAELEPVFQLLHDRSAMAETIMPPLIKAVFGLPIPAYEAAPRPVMAELAAALLAKQSSRAKIVYGSADCLYGMLGAAGRFCFGTQIAGFDKIIQTLLALDFGSSRAI